MVVWLEVAFVSGEGFGKGRMSQRNSCTVFCSEDIAGHCGASDRAELRRAGQGRAGQGRTGQCSPSASGQVQILSCVVF